MTRILVIAAHPDDETIGATTLLAASDQVYVLHVTDGAPRDPRWWPEGVPVRRTDYARQRRHEAEDALAVAGVPAAHILQLGMVDQEACRALPELARAITSCIAEVQPRLVVTHAYEGGHPDHDAVAFAVAEARARLAIPPCVIEMALYHGAGGELRIGELLAEPPADHHPLTLTQRTRRTTMLDRYVSQRTPLAPFRGLDHEAFRRAPAYDFTHPPHPGPLLYERWGLPICGAQWRELASRAARTPGAPARRAPPSRPWP